MSRLSSFVRTNPKIPHINTPHIIIFAEHIGQSICRNIISLTVSEELRSGHETVFSRVGKGGKVGGVGKVYKDGKEGFFSRFEDGVDISETDNAVWKAIDWSNKTVIDIGCGTGETASGIAKLGAELVVGVDYSENAIRLANSRHQENNLEFKVNSFEDIVNDNINKYDVLLSCGTLEHMDNPAEVNAFSLKSTTER